MKIQVKYKHLQTTDGLQPGDRLQYTKDSPEIDRQWRDVVVVEVKSPRVVKVLREYLPFGTVFIAIIFDQKTQRSNLRKLEVGP